MSKHTKGPWIAKVVERQGFKCWVIEERLYNGFQIASTADDEVQQGEANARLIAAAPELLRELEKAIEYFEANGGDKAYTFLSGMREALVKATGGSK